MNNDQKSVFWNNILHAVEAEPREVTAIRGASGHSHPVVAVGVDDSRRRVVMISAEADARFAALAQGDVQASMPSVRVVMARPLAVNLGKVAKLISELLGTASIGHDELEWMKEHQAEIQKRAQEIGDKIGDKVVNFVASPFSSIKLNLFAVVKEAIEQLSLIEVQKDTIKFDARGVRIPTFDIHRLAVLDPAEADRRMGVCSIPLYDIDKESIESLSSRPNIEYAKEVLRKHDILQYFFPPADHLSLGLVDNGVKSISVLLEQLRRTPDEGHPFGALEIIDKARELEEVISGLQEKALFTEGELGVEVGPNGRTFRAQVRFKPREGLLAKLSRVFSVKVDLSLKDILQK
jgi:hypothetical protein